MQSAEVKGFAPEVYIAKPTKARLGRFAKSAQTVSFERAKAQERSGTPAEGAVAGSTVGAR